MATLPILHFIRTMPLKHGGDCMLLGVTRDLHIYVEEIYSEDAWIAQHCITPEGTIRESIDEDFGSRTALAPLTLPEGTTQPQRGWHTQTLNFSGPRHRGLRDLERVQEVVRPLPIQAKLTLSRHLPGDIPPPMVMGLAESYVLAEARLTRPQTNQKNRPQLFVVCRRVRIAFALPQPAIDAHGNPYDYDSLVLHMAHLHHYDTHQDSTLDNPLAEIGDTLPQADLYRPMDCVLCEDHLVIADGGDASRNSAVHLWRVEQPPVPDDSDYDWQG